MSFDLEPVAVRPLRRSRAKTCAKCGGRGWIGEIGCDWPDACDRCQGFGRCDWPDACDRCQGFGRFPTMQLARALGVNRRDVYKVDTMTAGSKVGVRVLNAIARVFPEALS